MPKTILLISDIHGNYPALQAIDQLTASISFDYIINSGDSLVYAPFPEETLNWLSARDAISILGNTDQKVGKLLVGKDFKKPHDPDKRIMYTSAANALSSASRQFILSLKKEAQLKLSVSRNTSRCIGIFHGSPADPKEFLFASTPAQRFQELAEVTPFDIIITGHSHSPYVKCIAGKYFINPGSAGRMFDDDPRASCAILRIEDNRVSVHHLRIAYDIDAVVNKIAHLGLPAIYAKMFQNGQKLN